MGFDQKHRFQKRHDIHYSWKMTIKDISEISGEPIELLQSIFDEEFAKIGRQTISMLKVDKHCNDIAKKSSQPEDK